MKRIINKKLDDLLIYAPLWFPLIFIFLLTNFSSFNKYFLVGSLFIFAETHFASTWIILINKENIPWIKKNFYEFFILPIFVIVILISIWFFVPGAILIIHYLASGWHVTKQSIGISKLSNNGNVVNQLIIYAFSFSCLLIGLIKPGILSILLTRNFLNISLLIFTFFYFMLLKNSSRLRFFHIIKKNLSIITGSIIYLPLLFINNIPIALAIGVGMHWIQYLTIVSIINFRKINITLNKNENLKYSKNNKNIFLSISFIIFYSLIMTIFTLIGIPIENENEQVFSLFYLIPIIFQMYHFYIDGYIWRFSDIHVRENILPFLYKKEI